MKRDLKFEDLPKSIELLLEKVDSLEKEILYLKDNFQTKETVELMTRKETANFFSISLVTISSWVNHGILTSYRIGNRVYFKRSEIESALTPSNKKE